MTEPLKPCPFCGSTVNTKRTLNGKELPCLSLQNSSDVDDCGDPKSYWIRCIGCETMGPFGRTAEDAVYAWNTRGCRMNEDQAKKIIEECGEIQENDPDDYNLPCPRCGHPMTHKRATRNALSRHAKVYICACCGTHEAIIAMEGGDPIPFSEWSLPESLEVNDDC